jgi:hypothetical protein
MGLRRRDGAERATGMSDRMGIRRYTRVNLLGGAKLWNACGIRVCSRAHHRSLLREHVAATTVVSAAPGLAGTTGSTTAAITPVSTAGVVHVEGHSTQTVDDLIEGLIRGVLHSSKLGKLLVLTLRLIGGR